MNKLTVVSIQAAIILWMVTSVGISATPVTLSFEALCSLGLIVIVEYIDFIGESPHKHVRHTVIASIFILNLLIECQHLLQSIHAGRLK